MESNNRPTEGSKSSSSEEEADRSEQANDDVGTGRSYECVFCKRGFTTAQALGGHMNIHRKDRAKPKPSSSVAAISSNFGDDYYASLPGYPAIQSYPPDYSTLHHHHNHEVHINYQTFSPSSSWGFRPPHVQSPQILNHMEEDWRSNLTLQMGPSDNYMNHNKQKGEDSSKTDDELDLELRLGHDP